VHPISGLHWQGISVHAKQCLTRQVYGQPLLMRTFSRVS
jgi:hypothetical protein